MAQIPAWHKQHRGQTVTKSVETLTSGMSSIFSQISSLVQSEMEIETAAIEKRYERETIARLNERLDEPFVTVNTVTGDKGIKTFASRMQTSSLDLLRRRKVYPTRRRTSTSAS